MISSEPDRINILFVFAWLVVGGEETEVRLLARTLDPSRYRIDVVACFRNPDMPEQTHLQLEALGVDLDRTPYALSFEDTVDYLANKLPAYDIVVSCQNVADIYPALERLHWRPPLIEHGGLVAEALAGPKHLTSRYVGVCRSIREAAASRMPGKEEHAVEIPSMVDLDEFTPSSRRLLRASLGVSDDTVVVGWVGRLDAKKRVEDLIEAAALVYRRAQKIHFVIVGGADAFMPDYAERLRRLVILRQLDACVTFLGDRDDVPDLMAGMDIFVWLSHGEGMPHVIAEAGAASLPVIATADNGAMQQIDNGISGLFVPHQSPIDVAAAIERLYGDVALRRQLGTALRAKVEATYSAKVVVPQWELLFASVLRERLRPPTPSIFSSFIQGGFECSSHLRRSGQRLDLTAATYHDINAEADYRQMHEHGILSVRDGLRWHLIEQHAGHFDWSSFLPMLQAANATGTQIIWDLLHYGWPADIDIWSPRFIDRFADFAAAAARVVKAETDATPFYCPVNEISFHAWGGGDASYLNPFARNRGFELKAQLARASIAAMHEILSIDARARFVHCEPSINIAYDPTLSGSRLEAEAARLAQFQAFDMISGRMWPQLGGRPELLDIVGANYYHDNQWVHRGPPMGDSHPLRRPFRTMLAELHARYGRPVIVAETGREGELRAPWFEMVAAEVIQARIAGVPVESICLYPIADHVGWDDDRDCPSGLLGNRLLDQGRAVHAPLANAIRRFQSAFPSRQGIVV